MSLEGDCHEIEITPNLQLLVTFDMSLEGVAQKVFDMYFLLLVTRAWSYQEKNLSSEKFSDKFRKFNIHKFFSGNQNFFLCC